MKLTRAYLMGGYIVCQKAQVKLRKKDGNKISNLGIDKQKCWFYNTCKGKTYKGVGGLREKD